MITAIVNPVSGRGTARMERPALLNYLGPERQEWRHCGASAMGTLNSLQL
jgi:hypothetical protein